MKRNKLFIPVIILLSGFFPAGNTYGQYNVLNSAFGNGSGATTDSTEFTVNGIVALPLTGKSENENYSVSSGFWFQTAYFYTAIDNPFSADIPATFILYQNYPNPFNPVTTIKYGLPKISDVRIELYNLLGQKIVCLFNGKKSPGYHQLNFNAGHLASGVYIYSIKADYFYKVKKMILIK